MDIDVNGVKITLTKDQLQEIARQTAKYKVENINSYEDACDILDARNYSSNISDEEKLKTIIKAVNYIDNGNKEWKPDFTNSSIYKYLPWLERKASGWVVRVVDGCSSVSYCPLWLYFKDKKSAELIVNKFLNIYSKVWG